MQDPGSRPIARRADDYLAAHIDSVQPHTAAEYFTILLRHAVAAGQAGNFGISAALVVRSRGLEFVTIGRNTAISQGDPLGHAEVNAIRSFHAFARLDPRSRLAHARPWTAALQVTDSPPGVGVLVRRAPPVPSTRLALYATLEPCPMCTVAIINAGIRHVVVAVPDPAAGTLAPGRLAALPEAWPAIAASQGLTVAFTGQDAAAGQPGAAARGAGADEGTRIDEELAAMLHDAFAESRAAGDAAITRGVLLRPDIAEWPEDLFAQVARVV